MKRLKRLLIVLAAMVMATAAIFGCGKTPDKGGANPIAVYMPDGAPALAFAKLMHEENKLGKENLTYTVVKAENIGGFVANGSATVALMPITGASKVANGKYKAVSVITHGNIFLIGKGDATTLSALKDKKVGVVQLANVQTPARRGGRGLRRKRRGRRKSRALRNNRPLYRGSLS